MLTCPKCQRQLNDGARFCPSCGTAIQQAQPNPAPVYHAPANQPPVNSAPVYRAPANPAPAYQEPANPANPAPAYQAPVNPANPAPAYQAPVYAAPAAARPERPKKKFPKKALLFGSIGLVVAAAVVVCLLLFGGSGSKNKNSYALYAKDKEIYFSDLKNDPWQLTTRLIDISGVSDSDLYNKGDDYAYAACMSDNGKYIFFVDKVTVSGSSLYYKEVSDPEGDAVKIDSDVYAYRVDSAAKYVTYLKNDAIYQYDIGADSKEKLVSNAGRGFKVSKDDKRIAYLTSDGDFYLYEDGEKNKIASDVSIEYIDDDITVIYYSKDDALYKQDLKGDSEKEKILSDVYDVIKVYESGEFYFVKNNDSGSDAAEEYDPSKTGYSLYYYDGEEATELTNTYDNWSYNYAYEAPVITYDAYDGADLEKYVAVKGNATVLKQEKAAKYFRLNDAGTLLFYIDDISDDKDEGTLYRIEISGEEIGKPEVYDDDVYAGRCDFIDDESFYYFKDYKDGKGELYVDKNKVDDDVRGGGIDTPFELGKVFYYTDWKDGKGTLKVYEGKEATKIEDDVSDYTVVPDGRVLYMYDYSTKSYAGELYLWDDGKAEKLDEDVTCLVPYIDREIRFIDLD
ncbi:MAG: zinc-ribbon domain-containing protein [Oscillospiraceae bacterium]|nr:zinc-ribbon domain-containing protein [Oscillospiraceae bacterium]